MPRLRARFSKEQPVKYLSHLDMVRTFERSLKRAGIVMHYSEGYHPKPKLSFASALAVGVTSEAEYVDLEIAAGQSPDGVVESLNASLPRGIRVHESALLPPKAPSAMAIVNAASYCLYLQDTDGFRGRICQLLKESELWIRRTTKKGERSIDVRPWIFALEPREQCIYLEAASGSSGNLRVEEVLVLLDADREAAQVHRTGLWIRKGDRLYSPLQEVHG